MFCPLVQVEVHSGVTKKGEILFDFFTIQRWKVNLKPVIIHKLLNFPYCEI